MILETQEYATFLNISRQSSGFQIIWILVSWPRLEIEKKIYEFTFHTVRPNAYGLCMENSCYPYGKVFMSLAWKPKLIERCGFPKEKFLRISIWHFALSFPYPYKTHKVFHMEKFLRKWSGWKLLWIIFSNDSCKRCRITEQQISPFWNYTMCYLFTTSLKMPQSRANGKSRLCIYFM